MRSNRRRPRGAAPAASPVLSRTSLALALSTADTMALCDSRSGSRRLEEARARSSLRASEAQRALEASILRDEESLTGMLAAMELFSLREKRENAENAELDEVEAREAELERAKASRAASKAKVEVFKEAQWRGDGEGEGDVGQWNVKKRKAGNESVKVQKGEGDASVVVLVVESEEEDEGEGELGKEEEEEMDEVMVVLKGKIERMRVKMEEQKRIACRWNAEHAMEVKGDVDLGPELKEDEEDVYRFVMDGRNQDEKLFVRFNTDVFRSQLKCLLPGTWLNDEVINQYLGLLRERSLFLCGSDLPFPKVKCYFHLTLFYAKLMEYDKYDYSRVRRWTSRGTRKCDIFDMDLVFFPRNIGNAHWVLCMANMKEKRVEYFDSMGSSGRDCLQNVLRYLRDEFKDKKGGDLDTDQWDLVSHGSTVPQQNNTNDCGVFVCIFSNFLSLNQDLTFTCHDMLNFRRRICVDLMKGSAKYTAE